MRGNLVKDKHETIRHTLSKAKLDKLLLHIKIGVVHAKNRAHITATCILNLADINVTCGENNVV